MTGLAPLHHAILLAAYAHAEQCDKAGDPYLWHVLRVGVSLLPDLDAALLGLLHDVPEDNPPCAGPARLLLSEDQNCALSLLTRAPSDDYHAYIARIASAPAAAGSLARKVKLADIADNLRIDRLLRLGAQGGHHNDRAVAHLVAKYVHALLLLLPANEKDACFPRE